MTQPVRTCTYDGAIDARALLNPSPVLSGKSREKHNHAQRSHLTGLYILHDSLNYWYVNSQTRAAVI